jgi:hypothetical protein
MHDEHFLERLERLDDSQGQEALALYYDAPLVRALIRYAKLQGDSDRVAISLGDAREGPFVVVARNGAFVTALGRGMSPAPHPVIPKSALDAIRREHTNLGEAWRAAVSASRGRERGVVRTLLRGGPHVSREVMRGLIATANARQEFWVSLLNVAQDALYRVPLRCAEHPAWHTVRDAYFVDLARALHGAANIFVILAASDLKQLPATHRLMQCMTAPRPSEALTLYGATGPMLRAAWAVGKLGGTLLADCKASLRSAPSALDAAEAALGLASIGTRFARCRGEVRKALTIGVRSHEQPVESFRREFAANLLRHDLDRERARDDLRELGAEVLRMRAHTFPPGHPLNVPPDGALPDELTLPAAVNAALNVITDTEDEFAARMLGRVGAAVGALEPEELYFPHEVVAQAGPPTDVDDLRNALTLARTVWRPATVRVSPGLGRNERCGCGSGKKFKRCCGSPLEAAA